MKRLLSYFATLTSIIILFTSCEDALETKPSSGVSHSQIMELAESDPEAMIEIISSMVSGLYGHFVAFNTMEAGQHDDYGLKSILHIADLMGEDMVQTSGAYHWYFADYLLDARDKDYNHPYFVWQYFYRIIKLANDIILLIPADTDVPTLKAYRGQAFAIRAFSYHYLVQFYQKGYIGNEEAPAVPLILEVPNEEGNPRASMRQVYEQIVTDLLHAIELLDEYERPSKGYVDKSVAKGFFARVYLSMEEWELAASYAGKAREGFDLMRAEEYLEGFKDIRNREWMFGTIVNPNMIIVQTGILNFFSFVSSFSYGYASLTAMHKAIDRRLYEHMSSTDYRKRAYQAPDLSTFPLGGFNGISLPAYVNGKFGASDEGFLNTQDLVYMRAAEMLLIEAEALAMLGNTTQAGQLLQELMANRDPNYILPTNVLDEVRIQRRIELWGEIGIALFDIKRLRHGIKRNYAGTNHHEEAQMELEPESWKFTYQIPTLEIDSNPDISSADNNP